MSAISDDIREYEFLCGKYNEKVVYSDDRSPDCYGSHAKKLITRARQDSSRSFETEKYKGLCERYKQNVRLLMGQPDCFGKHAERLKARAERDREKERKKSISQTLRTAKLGKSKLTKEEWKAIVWAINCRKL
ncbi:MAG: hypothetical protein V4690_00595 [Patescibacteria group bacterium]